MAHRDTIDSLHSDWLRLAWLGVLACWLAAVTPLLASAENSDVLAAGQPMPAIALEDQFGSPHTLGPEIRVVLLTKDMDAGDVLEEALAGMAGSELASRGIAVVADIHRMPGLITRLFALPSLRKRAYPMWLDREGEATAALPSEAGAVSLLEISNGRLDSVRFLKEAPALRDALPK